VAEFIYILLVMLIHTFILRVLTLTHLASCNLFGSWAE